MATESIALAALLTVGLAVLAAGIYVASIGVGRIRTARALGETGPVPLGDVPDAAGLVEFEGVAQRREESLEAPLTETACLGYTVRSRTRTTGGREAEPEDDEDDEWQLDGQASAGVPFVVADGGDRVTVDPTNAVLTLDEWGSDETDWIPRADLSPATLERLEAVGLPDDDPSASAPAGSSGPVREYHERRLEPGTDVHVFGGAVVDADEAAAGTDPSATVGGGDWFEIATGSSSDGPSSVAADRRRSGSMYVIFGGLLAVPGTGLTLAGIVGLVSVVLL